VRFKKTGATGLRHLVGPIFGDCRASCQYFAKVLVVAVLFQEWENIKYDAAEPNFRRALELFRSSEPPNQEGIAGTLNSIGALYFTKGDAAAAERTCREALATARDTGQVSQSQLAIILINLGIALQAEGRAAAAEPLPRLSRSIRCKAVSSYT